MYSRAILLMLAAGWLYSAFLLSRVDRRWFAGRIIQCALMGIVPAICIWQGRESQDVLVLLGMAFLVFGIYPTMIERRFMATLGDPWRRDPRLLLGLLRLLAWDGTAPALRAVHSAAIEASTSTSGIRQVTVDRLAAAFLGRSGVRVRSRYLTPLLAMSVRERRWAQTVEIYERLFADAGGRIGPELSALMVRPYAELGRATEAVELFETSSAGPAFGDAAVERLVTAVALLALDGKKTTVAQILDENHHVLESLPEQFGPYWLGVADWAAGDQPAAAEKFSRVLEIVEGGSPAEALEWKAGIARRLDEGAAFGGRTPASTLDDAQVERILSIVERTRQEAQSAPVAANVFGKGIGPLTATLIGVNAAVWLLETAVGSSTDVKTLVTFGANVRPLVVTEHQYWRLISSMFLHVGIWHLIFNSYALYLFGTFLERWCKSRRTFLIYMASGLCGSAASAFLSPYGPSAGASGAIMGLVGASIVVVLKFGDVFPRAVRSMYATNFILVAVLTLLFGILQPGIDNFAHGGGLLMGLLMGLLLLGQRPVRQIQGRPETSAEGVHRRWSALWMNAMVVLSLAAITYTCYAAAKNVVNGGYPRVRPHMARRHDATGNVSVSVPTFWSVQEKDGATFFTDPIYDLMLSMAVQQVDAPDGIEQRLKDAAEQHRSSVLVFDHPLPGTVTKVSRLALGGRVAYNFRYSEERGAVQLIVDAYWTSPDPPERDTARVCMMTFELPKDAYPDYKLLIRDIVGSLWSARPTRSSVGTWVTLSPAPSPVSCRSAVERGICRGAVCRVHRASVGASPGASDQRYRPAPR